MAFMGHKPVPPGGKIVFDMYTSCAWLSAASGLLSLLVFLPGVFRETFIADRELEALKTMADQNQETAGAEQRIMRSVNAMLCRKSRHCSVPRRISRVVQQPGPAQPSAAAAADSDKTVKRRISRVAGQELQLGGGQAGTVGDIVRKFSTYISLDGSNVREVMDPDLSECCSAV